MSSYVFISYKHGDPSTKIARHLHDHFSAYADALDYEIYMDDKDNLGGDLWSDNVEAALNRTTHFVALLDTAFWLSKECRRELRHALNRFEMSGAAKSPRLLFVKAQEISPDLFRFDKDRNTGELLSPDPQVARVGDLHFLGPYDDNLQLVRLAWEAPAQLSDHMAQLFKRFRATLPKA